MNNERNTAKVWIGIAFSRNLLARALVASFFIGSAACASAADDDTSQDQEPTPAQDEATRPPPVKDVGLAPASLCDGFGARCYPPSGPPILSPPSGPAR